MIGHSNFGSIRATTCVYKGKEINQLCVEKRPWEECMESYTTRQLRKSWMCFRSWVFSYHPHPLAFPGSQKDGGLCDAGAKRWEGHAGDVPKLLWVSRLFLWEQHQVWLLWQWARQQGFTVWHLFLSGKWIYEVLISSQGLMQIGWCTLNCKFNQEVV